MRKVRLQLDALQVESFQTAAAPPERGTVQGHAPPPDHRDTGETGTGGGGSGDIFCISAYPCVPTNEHSCQGTCYVSCNGTCAPAGQMCA